MFAQEPVAAGNPLLALENVVVAPHIAWVTTGTFERAFAVRDYLASKGVAGNRIYLASYGPDVPRGNKQQSRRVEVVVVLN